MPASSCLHDPLHDISQLSRPPGLVSLSAVQVQDNLISEIRDGDFAGIPQLVYLTLFSNPIVAVDESAFLDIPLMSLPPENWSSSTTIVGTAVRPQDLEAVIGSNAIPAAFIPLALNPTPRSCTATSTLSRTISHEMFGLSPPPLTHTRVV